VVHKSGPQSTAFYAADRYGWLDIRNEARRRLRPTGQPPAEGIKKPWRLRGARIVETFSVKVLRKSRVPCTLLHELPFILVEPLASVQKDSSTMVTSRVAGDSRRPSIFSSYSNLKE